MLPPMSDWRATVEPLVHHSKIKVPYTWSVGDTGSRFLKSLRDEKKLLANKCPDTGKIFCPPKLNSPTTLKPLTEWIELSGKGTVKTFTERHYDTLAAASDAPKILALIELDGATQQFPHLLGEIAGADVKIGLRVEPVFQEDRHGHILDIKYFRPIK